MFVHVPDAETEKIFSRLMLMVLVNKQIKEVLKLPANSNLIPCCTYNAALCDKRQQLKAVNHCHRELRLRCLWVPRSYSGYCSIVVCVSEKALESSEQILAC